MNQSKIQYLAGKSDINSNPLKPFDENVCFFLNEFSKVLRKDKRASKYADVMAFAFWCRKANIDRLRESQNSSILRMGRGLVFHIAPSNVPVNFAFSYAFGMLAGNANIVRVSTKYFEQVDIICRVLKDMFEDDKFADISQRTQIVSYEHDPEITSYFSSIADGRVIWGGDNTIRELRSFPTGSRCVDIAFADRYSIGIISSAAVNEMSEDELNKFAERFYNDTYLMDQNACSAPHIIIWKKDADAEAEKDPVARDEINSVAGAEKEAESLAGATSFVMRAQKRFWDSVAKYSEKYQLADIKVSQKYSQLCEAAAEYDEIEDVMRYDNLLYVVSLKKIMEPIDKYRGSFGMFYQYEIEDIPEIIPVLNNSKIQTVAVEGIETSKIAAEIEKYHIKGIDRIVLFGNTLDIGIIWDGYDIIGTLSRIISY